MAVTAICATSNHSAPRSDSAGPCWILLESIEWRVSTSACADAPGFCSADQDHLGAAFATIARAAANRPALLSDQGVATYGDLLGAAYAVRNELQFELGVSSGDRVVILLPNGPEYVAAFYGALLAGAIVVPLPPDAEASRVRHAVTATDARAILSSKKVLRRRKQDLSVVPRELSLRGPFTFGDSDDETLYADENAPAAVFFTSGSSGEPKGVTLTHRNLISNAASIIEYLGITSNERALGLLPFYHAFGNSILQTHLLTGASVVLAGAPMFPETLLDAVESHDVTSLSGVPDLFQTLLSRTSFGQRDLPSLRYLSVAGGRLDPDQAQTLAFRAAPAKLIIMYGQTEATARLSYLPADEFELRYGSIGKGIPGVELQVVDEHGELVVPGATGEIRARGPNVMLGYWNDPVTTAQTIRDGWLYTGDLAIVDDDGFVYPQGRRSGLVKIAGFRVHPAEIEDFVRREAEVLEAIVVPFEAASVGTRFALFARPWEGDLEITAESLRRLCTSRLPRHKVPEHIEVLQSLPLNDSHKVDRRALQRRAESFAHVR